MNIELALFYIRQTICAESSDYTVEPFDMDLAPGQIEPLDVSSGVFFIVSDTGAVVTSPEGSWDPANGARQYSHRGTGQIENKTNQPQRVKALWGIKKKAAHVHIETDGLQPGGV